MCAVEHAVGVEQLVRTLLVEAAHLLEQGNADACAQHLLRLLTGEHGRERVAMRLDDQLDRVEQRPVEVEDHGRVAGHCSTSSRILAVASWSVPVTVSGVTLMQPSSIALKSVPSSAWCVGIVS